MKRYIILEKTEKDALEVIAMAKCTDGPCSECPLAVQEWDHRICLKSQCKRALEDYQKQD